MIESLETRLAPATITSASNVLTYAAGSGVSNNLSVTIGTDFVFNDTAETITTSISGATGSGTNTVTIPVASVTGIILTLGDGADVIASSGVVLTTQSLTITHTGSGLTINGPLTTTSGAMSVSSSNALTMNADINSGSATVALLANQDGSGTEGFSQANGTITTTNTSATAAAITVNTAGGGTGDASIDNTNIGGKITVRSNGGNILYAGATALTASQQGTTNGGASQTRVLIAKDYAFIATGAGSIGTNARPMQSKVPATNTVNLSAGSGGAYWTDWNSPMFLTGATATGAGNIRVVTANVGGHNLNVTGPVNTGSGSIYLAADDDLFLTAAVGGAGFSGTVYMVCNRDLGNTNTLQMNSGASITTSNATSSAVLLEGNSTNGTAAGGIVLNNITVGNGGTITATTIPAAQPTSNGHILAFNASVVLNAGANGQVVIIARPYPGSANAIGTSTVPIVVTAGTVTATATASAATNGGVFITGTGATNFTATVAGAAGFTGPITLKTNAGALTIAGATNAANGGAITLTGAGGVVLNAQLSNAATGAVAITGDLSGSGNIVTGAGPLTLTQAGNSSYAGVISGTQSVTKAGAGSLTLTKVQTFSGGTNINAGALVNGIANALPTGTALTIAGTLDLAGFAQQVASVTGSGTVTNSSGTAATFTVASPSPVTFGGILTGNLALTAAGSSTLTLAGAGSTYTGPTNVNSGVTLTSGVANALSTATTLNVAGTFDLAGFAQQVAGLSGNGTVTNSGGAPATFTVANSSDVTFGGSLTGNLALTKSAAGVLTLVGTSTYSLATTVSAGTLVADTSIPNSAITVANGATLAGAGGTIAKPDVVNGTLNPGDASAISAKLTTGNISFGSSGNLTIDLRGASAGTGYDQIIANGSVDLNGAALNVNLVGAFIPANGVGIVILLNNSGTAINGAFAGLAEGTAFASGGKTYTITYLGGASGHDIILTPVPPTVNLTVGATSGTEAASTVITVTALANGLVVGDQTVTLAVSGTGISAGDYTLNTTTITILDGQTSGQATFTIANDNRLEGAETATLTISNPSPGVFLGTTLSQNVSIIDNESATVAIAIGSNTLTEASGAAHSASVPATLTIVANGSGTVGSDVAVTANLAGNGDFSAAAASFGAGDFTSSNADIVVTAIQDQLVEQPTETFSGLGVSVTGNGGANVNVAGSSGTWTVAITDDDTATVTISAGATATEGGANGSITATLSVVTDGVAGGSALLAADVTATLSGNADYSASTVAFAAGQGNNSTGNGSLAITAVNDALIEGTETFPNQTLIVTGPATAGGSGQTITIIDDDRNHAPLGADTMVTTNEDTPYALQTADFGFSDPNDSPANNFASVKIASLPVLGTLSKNGTSVAVDDVISVAVINSGLLVYTPAADGNGAAYANFKFQVIDDGSLVNGGVILDPTQRTLTVNVAAVSDIVDDSLTTNEDMPITANLIAGTNGGSADNFEASPSLTSVTQGAHGSVTFLANGNVNYTPTADYFGPDAFTYTVTSGGATETGTVNVTVTPVADAVNDALTTNEDTPVAANVVTGTNGASADDFEGSPNVTSVTQGLHGSVAFLANGDVTYTPNADYYGSDSFTYTVTSGGATETGTVNVNINPVADVVNDSLTTNEDTPVTANVITGTGGASADNFEGSPSISSVTQGAHGAVAFLANGEVTYTPNADYCGSDSFTYTVTSVGVAETGTVNVNIDPVADVINDTLITDEDTPVTANVITGMNGASADSFDGTPRITSVSQGANGSVAFLADGSVTYTPAADFYGTDSFTYTVTSGGVTETGTVSVTINPVADVANDSLTTNEDTSITANVLTGTNGAFADNFEGSPSITSASQGAHGSVTFLANGSVSYMPNADYFGTDSFSYTATSGGVTETGTVNVIIIPVADVVNDSLTTNEDTPITANVIAGTNGASADNFEGLPTITSVSQGTHGAVSFLANGDVTYTPNADYYGSDSFTYTVTSGGVTETGTVNVTINPIADVVNDSLTTSEDTPITANVITGTNGASADNFEGSPSITSVSQGAHGSVSFLANGNVTYAPNADYFGSDSFTYTVSSGGVTETGTVNITINPIADVVNDSLTTNEDTPITANVMTGTNGASADNFEGLPSIVSVSQGAHGTVTFLANGNVTYTPNPDYNGKDSFTYTVTSGGVTDTGAVNVTINPVADVVNDFLTTNEDTPVTANVIAGTNGASADNFEASPNIISVTQGVRGSVTFLANGSVTYTPSADYFGTDSFSYTVDSGGVIETGTFSVAINPIADVVSDSLTTSEDTPITANVISGTNGASADNFEGSPSITSVTQGTHGSVTFHADGNVTFTPNPDYYGTDAFTYTVTSNGVTETGSVSVTIVPVADVVNDSLTTNEDTPITANFLTGTNGTSADNFEALPSITSVTQGIHGSVTFLANGNVTYTPSADYFGTDSFAYTVTSGGVTETSTVNVTINPVADVVNDSLATNEDTPITGNVITATNGASADNFEGSPSITSVSQGVHGSVTFLANGSVTYTPSADYFGTDSFTYTVASGGVSETGTVNVIINPVADAVNDALTTSEDTPITANVVSGTNGASPDNFEGLPSVTSVSQGAHGSVAFLANGSVTYTPSADYFGSDSFTYTVTSGGVTETGTVNVTINFVTDVANDSLTTHEDTPITANVITGTNGAGADNFEGSPSITSVSQGTNGSVVFLADGSVTYTPNPDFNGVDAFTYTVTSSDVTETGTVNVTINSVADVVDDSLTTNEDTPITANVITGTNGASADNFEGSPVITSVSQGAHGSVAFLANGDITYTPSADYFGADSFTYTVASGGNSETGIVRVTINSVTDVVDDLLTTNEDTPITANVLTGTNGASSDSFEASPSIVSVTQGTHGAVSFLADGSVTYEPDLNYFGPDSFTYAVVSNGVSETGVVSVTVNPVADTPSVTNATTVEGTQSTSGLVIARNPADGAEVAYFKITNITNGTLFQNDGTTPIANGAFITFAQASAGLKFTPGAGLNNFNATFSFNVQASVSGSDAGLGGDVISASISVKSVINIGEPPITVWTQGHGGFLSSLPVSGGTSAYSLVGSNNIPSGLLVSVVGGSVLINGTPMHAGIFTADVTVKNASGSSITKAFTLVINPPIASALTGIPMYKLGNYYSANLISAFSGGTGALQFAFDLSTTLPRGLTLVDGVISGIPSSAPTVNITISAVDAVGAAVRQMVTLAYASSTRVGFNSTPTTGGAGSAPVSNGSGIIAATVGNDLGDSYAQADVVIDPANGQYAGVLVHANASGGYLGEIISTSSGFVAKILKIDAAGTVLAQLNSVNTPVAGAGTLRLEAYGASLKLLYNGALVAYGFDTQFATGKVGIRATNGAANSIDRFSFDVLSTLSTAQLADFADNFGTAAFGNQLSHAWTERLGNIAVTGGQAAANGAMNIATVNGMSFADESAQVDIVAGTASQNASLVLRYQAGGAFYVGGIVRNGGGFLPYLLRYTGAGFVDLASMTNVGGVPLSSTGTLRFEVAGSSLKLFWNGALVAYGNDSGLIAPGLTGLRVSQGLALDNFAAGQIAAATPPLPFSDSFNMPVNTNQLPRAWDERLGNFAINASQQAVGNANGPSIATVHGVSNADVAVQTDMILVANQYAGVIARYQQANGRFYLAVVQANSAGTAITPYLFTANGSFTQLNSNPIAVPIALGSCNTIRFEVIGNALKMFVNGKLAAYAFDTGIAAAGLTGIRISKGAIVDNFSSNRIAYATPSLPFSDAFNGTAGESLSNYWIQRQGQMMMTGIGLKAIDPGVSIATINGLALAAVRADADILVGAGQHAGVMVRYQSNGGFYVGLVASNSPGVGFTGYLFRYTPGVGFIQLASTPVAGGNGALSLEANGPNLKLFFGSNALNQSLVAYAYDTTYAGGRTGVRGNMGATFASFKTSQLAIPGAQSAPFAETFAANAPTQQLSANWTERAGNFSVLGGPATGVASARTSVNGAAPIADLNGISIATVNGINAVNVDLSADVALSATNQFASLIARYSGNPGSDSYYSVYVQFISINSYGVGIVKVVNGSKTVLGTVNVASFSGGLRLQVVNNSLSAYLDNSAAAALSVADASITAAGAVGMRVSSGAKVGTFVAG